VWRDFSPTNSTPVFFSPLRAARKQKKVNAARYNEKARLLSLRSAVVLARRPPRGFARHVRVHFVRHGAALVTSVAALCDSAPPEPPTAAAAAAVAGEPATAAAAESSKGAAAEEEDEEDTAPATKAPPPRLLAGASAAAVAPSAGFLLALRRMLPTLRAVFTP
jgi:hypothetical protein